MPKGKKGRRKFTTKELYQIEGYARIRLPMETIAHLLGTDKDYLVQLAKHDDALNNALIQGRAQGSVTAMGTLFQQAVGRPGKTVKRTLEDGTIEESTVTELPPNPGLLKFWCQTQEGCKTTVVNEHSGLNGAPIKTQSIDDMTPEQVRKEYEAMKAELLQEKD